ncbi:hypothetical protein ACLVWU_15350 [Bdellovibrio sp. HCB290]|uniref:hypothetical protein n=1 Tax=Bdellovibrio sp. HCB290 TaxID=3394356 RepID=UPI0039B3B065
MRLSVSKLVIILGTPIVLMGYQNCAKLGTENLLGESSAFVAADSMDLASTGSSTSSELLAEAKQSCYSVAAADDVAIQSCWNLFCSQLDQDPIQNDKSPHLCQRLHRLVLVP